MNEHDADSVLAGLDPQQREVAANPLGPMVVLAGAGTGKTRAITHRIAYGVHSGALVGQRTLAVTFTARAAGEMRTRLRELGVPQVVARTFHAAALSQLRYFWPQAIGGGAPEVVGTKGSLVGEAAGRLRLQVDRTGLRDLAGEVEWAKVSMLTPETYPAAARRAGRQPADLDVTAMARLLDAYEDVKSARGVIDFEDVLLLAAGILAEREDIARQVRDQYRHFVVDEYQDVNTVQQYLLSLWVGERKDLCVVGDPAQTIYSFTGASPRHLRTFAQRFEGAAKVELVRNYRSDPPIVRLANDVMKRADQAFGSVTLQAQREGGVTPKLVTYPDDPAEARGVAKEIKRLLADGVKASGIAVLYRTNAQSEAFETALADAGVPYQIRGGERFFHRDEVRKAVLLMRGAARSDDGSKPLPDVVADVLSGAGWSQQAPAAGASRERWESLQSLAELSKDVARTVPGARLRDFVAELDRRASEQHAPKVEGVTLASLHAAKGLEWDAVFFVGASDGLLPIMMANAPEAIEEERRLMYVGITRARRFLQLSYSRSRHEGGRASRNPSRFLDGLGDSLDGAVVAATKTKRAAPAPKRSTAKCRTCGKDLYSAPERKIGRCTEGPATSDEAQFEALREWRAAVAKRDKVPAFVVFTDATLVAIAETLPANPAGLRAIAGVGNTKISKYGASVLAVLGGAKPLDEVEKPSQFGDFDPA